MIFVSFKSHFCDTGFILTNSFIVIQNNLTLTIQHSILNAGFYDLLNFNVLIILFYELVEEWPTLPPS